MLKKLDLYAYFSQKWQHIEKTLMKLNYVFFDKRWWIIRKVKWYLGKNYKDSLKTEFDSKPVYNKKYLKAKIKSYNKKINTNFHNNTIPKADS